MIRSRILWITVAVILTLTLGIFFLTSGDANRIPAEELKPSFSEIRAKADILMEFGDSVRDVKIVNAEKGYFAVEPQDKTVEIVDKKQAMSVKNGLHPNGRKSRKLHSGI